MCSFVGLLVCDKKQTKLCEFGVPFVVVLQLLLSMWFFDWLIKVSVLSSTVAISGWGAMALQHQSAILFGPTMTLFKPLLTGQVTYQRRPGRELVKGSLWLTSTLILKVSRESKEIKT